ncbi:hypothetical protein F511_45297 [Dorcoceras hygrometricum]|uniref:Uncharacterized protein n=1 Tax=Dorcoceras hygrometricum TaxID=472368 RepID=A0A2Z6ZWU2_9LAMI|nr:hypothetical protein F511_45297 [Dorcoceras hygrometricum]
MSRRWLGHWSHAFRASASRLETGIALEARPCACRACSVPRPRWSRAARCKMAGRCSLEVARCWTSQAVGGRCCSWAMLVTAWSTPVARSLRNDASAGRAPVPAACALAARVVHGSAAGRPPLRRSSGDILTAEFS